MLYQVYYVICKLAYLPRIDTSLSLSQLEDSWILHQVCDQPQYMRCSSKESEPLVLTHLPFPSKPYGDTTASSSPTTSSHPQ